ncbi:MAG: single-stranded-DNA-specific exonuclease RecJ [Patescibacteria group bacterium]
MKKWELLSKKSTTSTTDIIKILLENRGIKTKVEEKEFLSPTHPDKLKTSDFGINPKELKKAITRIEKAKKTGEKVIVWGDYDADGICGAAILWEALYYSGVNALPFIPERRTEGYGLNIARMKQLKKEDPRVGLIITVDNGIVAHEKVDTAKELGLDVIITDHHLPRETKPKAYAILHTTAISGAGVAYLLAREFTNLVTNHFNDWLGLVALATVADMVPLIGPARSLVFHGIPSLRTTVRPGIVALCEIARIPQETISTYEIGFLLAPRLNAAGRLEHALESLRLLCTKSITKARERAFQLNETNSARQQMVVESVFRAREQVLKSDGGLPAQAGLIFVAHESYHEGIVGLVASRLVEEFGRPAIVVSKGDEFSRGSARSVSGFNIVELLDRAREFLIEGGGHAMAAGFTVRTQHLELLSQAFKNHADGNLTDEHLTPKIRIECEIPLSVVTLALAQEVAKFVPFGIGNPEPVFATRKVLVRDARLVGSENKHLKLQLTANGLQTTAINAIGFGMGNLYSKLSPDAPIDTAYTVVIDTWNGDRRIQLKLKDIKFGNL